MRGLFERVKSQPAKITRSRSRRKTLGQPAPTPELCANGQPPQQLKPVSMNHFEPLPAQPSTPFDHLAWPTEVDSSASFGSSALGLGLHASEFFYAPLPFDSDFVESMQSLSSLSEMQDASLPGTHITAIPCNRINTDLLSGFAWMKQMPPADFGMCG